jgi:hypothetical protein
LSAAIAEKLFVNEPTLSCGTDPDPPEPPEDLLAGLPLLPQAATARAAAATTAVSPALFVTENKENHLVT